GRLAERLAVDDDDGVGGEDETGGASRRHRARLPQRQPRDGAGQRARLERLVDRARLDAEVHAERREQLAPPRRRRGQDQLGGRAQRRRSATAAITMPSTPTTFTLNTRPKVSARNRRSSVAGLVRPIDGPLVTRSRIQPDETSPRSSPSREPTTSSAITTRRITPIPRW